MEEQNVVHSYNGVLVSLTKERNYVPRTTWLSLENIMLCLISKTEKRDYYMINSCEVPKAVKSIEMEGGGGSQRLQEGRGE